MLQELCHKVWVDEKTLHYDIISLYASVNKNDVYSIDHPEIIVTKFRDIRDHFGIVPCKFLLWSSFITQFYPLS